MLSWYQIAIRQYDSISTPMRLAVGDVIRCPSFRWGVIVRRKGRKIRRKGRKIQPESPQLGSKDEVWVAWISMDHMQQHLETDSAIEAHDESRGSALFLVTWIALCEIEGPGDVGAPARLFRHVRCSRLMEDNWLKDDTERITFCLDDPMSLCRPQQAEIEIVGHALLPVGWPECAT